tara:strand:+ start:4590 stop:5477 length:888 start_codon:yes stop_codon:yes gene_type:complete
MLKKYSLDEYVQMLNISNPNENEFNNIVNEFSYFKTNTGTGKLSNYNFERGLLVYLLVGKLKPKNILEIGTGSGFSTLCMAMAMTDFELDGKIYTIDYLPHGEKTTQHYKKSEKSLERFASREEIWNLQNKPKWIEKIEILTGYTSESFHKHELPLFDFCYIDGGHYYSAVKNDFFTTLLGSNDNCVFLLDDYIDKPEFDVKNFVDNEIATKFNVDLIDTDKSRNIDEQVWVTKNDYGMCFIRGKKDELIEHFGRKEIERYVDNHRKFEKRLKLRNDLNKKIPFMKNIRFSKFLR